MSVAATAEPPGGRLIAFLSGIGLLVALLALPVVLLLGAPLGGWVLGFVLWCINWGIALAMAKMSLGMTATAAVGVSGVSFIARAWLIAIVLFVVALRYSEPAGLTAAAVFLGAFTTDLLGRTVLFASRQRAPKAIDR
jgi:hypothetical protein